MDIQSPNGPAPLDGATNAVWPRSIAFWMAAFYVALFIIRPWEKLFPELATIHLERVYALMMIVVAFGAGARRFRLTQQTVAILLFLASMVLSAQFGFAPELCSKYVYRYITLVAFYLVLTLVVTTPYELVCMVTCYIVTMWLYLVKALWEFYVHGAGTRMMGVLRLQGIESTFGFPNDLAFSIVLSLPMVYFLFKVRKEFSCLWPRTVCKLFNLGLASYFLLAVTSVVLTNSRSGMLGFVFFIGLLVLRGKGVQKKVLFLTAAVAMLAAVWIFTPEENKGRYRTIWDPDSGPSSARKSADGRWYGFLAGVEICRNNPILGVGPGSFMSYRVAHVDGFSVNPHNIVGQILGEGGLLGTGCFLLLFSVTLLNCRRTRLLARGSLDATLSTLSHFALASRDSVLLLLVEGLFNHNVDRFNWLWLAAFCLLATDYAIRISSYEHQIDEKPTTEEDLT